MSETTTTAVAPSIAHLAGRSPVMLPCPCCHENEAGIAVSLHRLDEGDGGDLFTCCECEEVFSLNAVRDLLATMERRAENWRKVLNWLGTAPTIEPEE